MWEFRFLYILSYTWYECVVFRHSNLFAVSRCGFNLHFLVANDIVVLICHPYIHLGELSVQFFCSYFNWVVYFLPVDFFVRLWLANIFSQSVTCLLILRTGSFTEHHVVIVMKFRLSIDQTLIEYMERWRIWHCWSRSCNFVQLICSKSFFCFVLFFCRVLENSSRNFLHLESCLWKGRLLPPC